MESRVGLDYIVEHAEYAAKLAAALSSPAAPVKKQVFELLSALCVYNSDGYARAVDTLERYKVLKNERYRLSVVVEELKNATSTEYKTALVAFINCLIISAPRLPDRTRVRNEFIGLGLLSVLNNLSTNMLAMPKLTKENNRLFVVKVIGNEFFDKVPYLDYYKIIIAYVEYFRMYDYSDGYRAVIDYRDINIMSIIARVNLVELKEFSTLILSGYGARLKGIHIITSSKAVENLLRIITPLFNPKLVARFRVHGTLESLHEVISQDRLPKELGGTGRSLKEIQDDWIDLLSSKETSEFFREINKAQVNEAYRMDDLKNEEMGLPGTFRTLSVD